MEGDKLFQLPSLSQLIIHFCLEFKIEKNIKQFAYYVAFTSSPKTLWWKLTDAPEFNRKLIMALQRIIRICKIKEE